MSKHLSEKEILEAFKGEPLTVMELSRKLGRMWESGLNRRLVIMLRQGLVKRKKFGKLFVYWKEAQPEEEKEAKSP